MLDWTRKLIAHVVTNIYFKTWETYMISSPTFLPKTIRFDFQHTSQLNLECNTEMAVLWVQAKTVMAKAKEKLRTIIRETQKPEVLITTETDKT